VLLDTEPEEPGQEWGKAERSARLTTVFARALSQALDDVGEDDEWMLFLEDDLDFHPRIGMLVDAWRALDDPRCVLASLFNPSLQAISDWGTMDRAFAAKPETFLGTQALLIRRGAAEKALAGWKTVAGMQSQRLAQLLGKDGPIWVHRPSLVQHVAEDSSWGARVQRTLDFDPSR
jgi:hypothetical protein